MNDSTTETSGLSTGDDHVDTALTRLDELDEADLDQHVEIYDDIQRSLSSALDSHDGDEAASEAPGQ